MSKYLTSEVTGRYSKNGLGTSTRNTGLGDNDPAFDAQAVTPVFNLSGTDYTENDQQQFAELSVFQSLPKSRSRKPSNCWASCQFTDQDDAEFQQLQQDLNAITGHSR